MAVYSWIYANAKLDDIRIDYISRGGYQELVKFVAPEDNLSDDNPQDDPPL